MCLCKNNLVFIFVILCLCVPIYVNSYNVDTQNVARYYGEKNSMFGFTVAAHIEHGEKMVLVGAPKAQTYQEGVQRGGAVYRCRISRNNECSEIPFNRDGDTMYKGRVIDQKSNQWFGASLYSSGPNGPVVACASRYVYFSIKYDRRDPVGTCYVARNNFLNFSEYSPCRTWQWGYHRQGSCQAGFSAAISKDGERLFVGAPGNCYWQGRSFSIDAKAEFPFTPPLFYPYGSGKVIRQSLETRPAVIQTQEGSAADDDSYLGYSMTVGNFYGKGVPQGVAAGMPRGGGLLGKVLLYSWNLTNFMNITGKQMGSYFGYAVAAGDVDGDGFDDIIIGAPLFVEPNNKGRYEVGRVYVVYQRKGIFKTLHELDGFNSKSRFGLSLASLGDINLDGYGDFAVGAPYDGPNGRGAVYIFHGSKDGVIKKHTQVIYAEDMSKYMAGNEPPLHTFGFSLAGGIDLDENDYPDTIIGAYSSDTAFFLRSRPVVKVEGYAQFRTPNKEIVLENKDCPARIDGVDTHVACTIIETCLKYTGVGVPGEIYLELQYALDTQKKKDPRMFFLEGDRNVWNGTRKLRKDSSSICTEKAVYITNDVRDKLTPLDIEVTYSMDTDYLAYGSSPAPILDVTSKSLKKDSISIHKNCGPDNVCKPNLVLEIKPNVERYLLASNEVLVFDITVSNKGEDSFETTFAIQMPEDVYYNGIQDTGDVKISCGESVNNHTITCNIGNPLPAQKIANFKMFFKPHYKEGMKRFYVFNANVNSTNPEEDDTTNDNNVEIKLPIWVNSRLELKGTSRPSEVHYNYSYYAEMDQVKHEREIGPQVIHLYTITNNGPSRVNMAEVLIFWPYATASGQDLMYLLEPPHVLGNVRCLSADFNYQGYQVERRKKTIWETLGIDVESSTTSTESSSFHGEGILIEEGKVKTGEKPKVVNTKNEEKYEKSTGDASFDHIERHSHQKSTARTDGQGRAILVTPSGVRTEQTYTNTSYYTPGGKTVTYQKKTTIIRGPDGKIINETISEEGDSKAGASFQQGTHDFSISGQHGGSQRVSAGGEINVEIPYSSVEFDMTPPPSGQGGQKIDYSSESYYQRGGQRQGGQSYHQSGSGGQYQSGSGGQYQSGSGGQYQSGGSQHQSGAGYYQSGESRHQGGENQFQSGGSQYQSGGSRQSSRDRTSQQQGGHYQHQGGQGYYQSGQNRNQYGRNQQENYGIVQNRSSEADYVQQSIGAATLGQGAKVGVLDLGISHGNVDQSLSQQGASIDQYSEHEIYDPDLGRIEYTSHKPRGIHKSRTYSAERSGQYDSNEDGSYHQSGGHQDSYSESHWSSSGTGHNYNLNIGNDQYENEHRVRRKRQAEDLDLKQEVQCKATKCKLVKCFIGPMLKDQDATIALRTRVNVNTLRSISTTNGITFSTMMVGKITNVPYIGIPSERETVKHEIVTNIIAPEPETQPDVVPLWVVVLSAVAGALILLLLIFLFYKCGFFKRNRPSNVPERQPLNRNGHYSSGDEAL